MIGYGSGGTAGERFSGDMSEIAVYSSKLTGTNLARVNSYFAIKYGMTLSGGTMNYLDSTGVALWSATANSGYGRNITVIGRDDNSDLSQKQSKSVNSSGSVTIAVGNLFSTNTGNINDAMFVTDRSFLAFGDNDGQLTTWSTANAPLAKLITSRVWKVQENGSDTTGLFLSIPDNSSTLTGKLPAEHQVVYLFVDTDANFTT